MHQITSSVIMETVPRGWLCDGDNDCGDHSDEDTRHNCRPPPVRCQWDQWLCPGSYSVCINKTQICNGVEDCPNGDDESIFCNDELCDRNNSGCSHICHNTPFGATCFCPDGMQLNDSKTCIDANECEPPGICSQICDNIKSSYKCRCDDGYNMQSNHHTCKANSSDEPFLIIVTRTNFLKVALSDGEVTVEEILMPDSVGSSGSSLAFHVTSQTMFWVNSAKRKIFRANVNGTSSTVIVDGGIVSVTSLAIDWIAQNLYWTDAGLDKIDVASLDGTFRAPLITDNITDPMSIAVDPRPGIRRLFWSSLGQQPRIETALLDGSERRALPIDKLFQPIALTLDLPTKHLYFTDARAHFIKFCNYDGTGCHVVVSGETVVLEPRGIAVFEDFIYFSAYLHGVGRCNKFTCNTLTSLSSAAKLVTGIAVYHPVTQLYAANPCDSH